MRDPQDASGEASVTCPPSNNLLKDARSKNGGQGVHRHVIQLAASRHLGKEVGKVQQDGEVVVRDAAQVFFQGQVQLGLVWIGYGVNMKRDKKASSFTLGSVNS